MGHEAKLDSKRGTNKRRSRKCVTTIMEKGVCTVSKVVVSSVFDFRRRWVKSCKITSRCSVFKGRGSE